MTVNRPFPIPRPSQHRVNDLLPGLSGGFSQPQAVQMATILRVPTFQVVADDPPFDRGGFPGFRRPFCAVRWVGLARLAFLPCVTSTPRPGSGAAGTS